MTTVRGITSRVDIVWTTKGEELRKSVDHTINSTANNWVTYIDIFSIPQLNTTNEGQTIQCMVVINGLLPVMTSDIVTLNVSGKLANLLYMFYIRYV